MPTQIYVNLPVKDLPRSMSFFQSLGFEFNRNFTNEQAACLVLGPNQYAMLLIEPFFQNFTRKPVADATRSTEVLIALDMPSRAEVDGLLDKALAAGATEAADPQDHGWMYSRSFADLDGHQWEILYMDAATAPESV